LNIIICTLIFIFATVHRAAVISEKHRERIEKYIAGIVNNNKSHLYAISANPDHEIYHSTKKLWKK
jgi:REP element-mobilizing transposase RayT